MVAGDLKEFGLTTRGDQALLLGFLKMKPFARDVFAFVDEAGTRAR